MAGRLNAGSPPPPGTFKPATSTGPAAPRLVNNNMKTTNSSSNQEDVAHKNRDFQEAYPGTNYNDEFEDSSKPDDGDDDESSNGSFSFSGSDGEGIDEVELHIEVDDYMDDGPECIIEAIPNDDLEKNDVFCTRVKRFLAKDDTNNLIESLIHNVNYSIGAEKEGQYLRLAKYVVEIKPSVLLPANITKQGGPLHTALAKSRSQSTHMRETTDKFIKCICDAAAKDDRGEKMNPCQKAIHQEFNELTCLHFAIEQGLEIAGYLVEKASLETLTQRCRAERQTVLHMALKRAVKQGIVPNLKTLIEKIIERAPTILLESDGKGLSPYRYFKHQMKPNAQSASNSNNDGNSPKAVMVTSQRVQDDVDKEEQIKKKASAKYRSANDVNNNATQEPLKKGRGAKSAPRKGTIGLRELSKFLKEKCLESGTFPDSLKALYGSMEDKHATWLNLLGIELPGDFKTKLKFRKPDPNMVFVGVQVPKGNQQLTDTSGKHIIVQFFEWLIQLQVKGIMKVIIRDDPMNPSGDDIIQSALKPFDVQYLDWDRKDISCKTLRDACPNLREISLYSSGNSAVLHGWADANGLTGLHKLKSVNLIVSKGWDSPAQTLYNLNDLKECFEKSQSGRILKYPLRLLGGGSNQGSQLARGGPYTKDHRWLRFLQDFTEGIGDPEIDSQSIEIRPKPAGFPTVCIIDDGAFLNELYTITEGRSFGQHQNYNTNPGECFPSTDGHGASMARIIHSICPYVRLYVAKLERAGGRGKFTMKDATKAIQWALQENVDIISMSWTIDEALPGHDEALDDVFKKASRQKSPPVIFCASQDQGSDSKDASVYPYKCKYASSLVVGIGAADEYGAALPQVSKDISYLLPCHGLDIWTADDTRRIVEGSSEATALAAGLAALILACRGSTHSREGIEAMRNPSYIKTIFDSMINEDIPGRKFIQPKMFAEVVKEWKRSNPSIKLYDPNAIGQRMAGVSERCHSTLKARGIYI